MRDGVSFFRIGSDPEYLFESGANPTWTLARADRVLGCSREEGTAAAIGTDGHATTGELRPRPSHNVYLHLHDIALMIDNLAKYVETDRVMKEWGKVRISAVPFLHGEPLGGHIHVSFFVGYRGAFAAYKSGMFYQNGALQRRPTILTKEKPDMDLMEEYVALATKNRIPTPDLFARVMDYFNVPLEAFAHNSLLRGARFTRYGHTNDLVRTDLHTDRYYREMILKRGAYYHYEYRRPSSWLRHPSLAYLHLALSKLVLLNFDLAVYNLPLVDTDALTLMQPQGREILFERVLHANHWKRTKDLSTIEEKLREVDNLTPDWGLSPEVNIEAWRALL